MIPAPDPSIAGQVFEIARTHPDWCAAIDRGRRYSYAEFARSVHRLAVWLDRAGIAPGTTVGVALSREYDHLATSLALLRLGCSQVTLAAGLSIPFRAETAARCGVGAVVAADAADGLPEIETLLPDVARIHADPVAADAALPAIDLDAPALIFPSSGTTGRPKIISVSQRQYLAGSWNKDLGAARETVYRPISIEFDAAKRQHLVAAMRGIATVLYDPEGRHPSDAVCREQGVQQLFLSPAQARGMIDAARASGARALPAGIRLHVGGAPVSAQIRRDALEVLTDRVWITYGTSECGTISGAWCGADAAAENENNVGRALPEVEIEIVDDEDRPLQPGAVGRVRVRTPGMATGYLDDPELSARTFRGGWFHSGDLGRLAPDGSLRFEGRADDMMCLSGVNVFPQEIEKVVENFPGVVECAAFPLRSAVHGDIPVAAVRVETDVDLAELARHCRSALGIRAPRKLVRVAALPRNDAGKVVRRELAALLDGDETPMASTNGPDAKETHP